MSISNNERSNYHDSVKRIQEYLRTISKSDHDIPNVISNGTYDEHTEKAVNEFQRKYMENVTGKVDYDTWQKLLEESHKCSEMQSPPTPISPFSENLKNGKLTIGDRSDLVIIVNTMISCLGICYDEFENIHITDLYDENTANAVSCFQHTAGLPETGELDKSTWNALAKMYNKYVCAGR